MKSTIRQAAYVRRKLGLEAIVRFEHHITEACKSIVKQPYNRREELVEIAKEVPSIAPNMKAAIRKQSSAWTIPRIFWIISCRKPMC
jgi:hypothetical protein